jgi:hypothetical protein
MGSRGASCAPCARRSVVATGQEGGTCPRALTCSPSCLLRGCQQAPGDDTRAAPPLLLRHVFSQDSSGVSVDVWVVPCRGTRSGGRSNSPDALMQRPVDPGPVDFNSCEKLESRHRLIFSIGHHGHHSLLRGSACPHRGMCACPRGKKLPRWCVLLRAMARGPRQREAPRQELDRVEPCQGHRTKTFNSMQAAHVRMRSD